MPQPPAFAADMVAAAVLHGSGDAVVACDRDGVIRFWNSGAAHIFGFSADEAVGQTLDIVIPERLRARHWHGYRQVMQTGQSRYGGGDTLSVPALRKDGSQVSIEFTIAPLRDSSGGIAGLAAIMRDVTARFDEMKALRRQLRELTGR
ncbi:MAG: PAS domain-containing protein [Pseudolabrys sp.]